MSWFIILCAALVAMALIFMGHVEEGIIVFLVPVGITIGLILAVLVVFLWLVTREG